MSRARRQARSRAVQALYQWQMTGNNLADIEAYFLDEQDMKGVELAYFQELLHQIPAKLKELDEQISPFLSRPLEQVDPVERAILRLAAYELAYRPDVPYRVIINESVELTKVFGAEHGHKFINGVVDKAAQSLRKEEVQARKKS